MPDSALKLSSNRYVEWCLARLTKAHTKTPNKGVLQMYQSVGVYYSALGIKRDAAFSKTEKKVHAAKAYGDYIAEAWLNWLETEADHAVPDWLTKTMLGKSTLGGGTVLFDGSKDTLWRKYGDTGANIRAFINPIVDTFMVNNNEQKQLPSGEQAPDLMEYLHRQAWNKAGGNPRKMTRPDFERAIASGANIEEMAEPPPGKQKAWRNPSGTREQESNEAGKEDGLDKCGSSQAPGKEESTSDSTCAGGGASQVQDNGSPRDHDRGGDIGTRKSACEGAPGMVETPEAKPVDATSGSHADGESAGDPDVSILDQSEMVNVITPMPDSYLLPNALVFAFFGKVADRDNRDPDLDLALSNGPPNKKVATPSDGRGSGSSSTSLEELASASSGDGKLSSRKVISLMVGAGESQSRGEFKECKRKLAEEASSHDLKRKLCAVLDQPDEQQAKLVDNVVVLCDAIQQRVRVETRKAQVATLKEELALLREMGDEEEASIVKNKLLALLKQIREAQDTSIGATSAFTVKPIAQDAGGKGVAASSQKGHMPVVDGGA